MNFIIGLSARVSIGHCFNGSECDRNKSIMVEQSVLFWVTVAATVIK